MSQVLLKEYLQIKPSEEMLNEFKQRKADGMPIVVQGVIQRADAKNQNGRIYPYEILKKETDRYKNDCVAKGIAMGELDHAQEPIIMLQNISHVIDDLWWEGKDLLGKVRLLNTPKGKIAQEIVLSGIPLGISSRAVGSVSKNEALGADEVGSDLSLVCWDLVGTPSTHNAFLKVHESKEIKNFNPNKVLPPKYRIKQTLSELLNK